MEQADRLSPDDVVTSRALVRRLRRRATLAAAFAGLLFSSVCAATMYFLGKPPFDAVVSLFVGVFTFLIFGLPLTVHWWRHWRFIFDRLDLVEQRVKSGEVVYGSQVSFDRDAI